MYAAAPPGDNESSLGGDNIVIVGFPTKDV